MTDPERFRRIDEVFQAVCDLAVADRDMRIRELCAGDEELRSAVAALLERDGAEVIVDRPLFDLVQMGPPSEIDRYPSAASSARRRGAGRFTWGLCAMLIVGGGVAVWQTYLRTVSDERAFDAQQREQAARVALAHAELENRRSKETLDFIQRALHGIEPGETWLEAIDTVAARLDAVPPDDPKVEAGLRRMIGLAYGRAGRFDQGLDHASRAIVIERNLHDELHPDVLESIRALSRLYLDAGRHATALRTLDGSLERLAQEVELDSRQQRVYAVMLCLRGLALARTHERGESARVLGESLELLRRIDGTLSSQADALRMLGLLCEHEEEYAEAEMFLTESLDCLMRDQRSSGLQAASTTLELARAVDSQRRLDDAEEIYRRAVDLFDRPGSDPQLAEAQLGLGVLLRESGRAPEAEAVVTASVTLRRALHADPHPATGIALEEHGNVLFALGRYSEAESRYRAAHLEFEATLGPGVAMATVTARIGLALEAQECFAEAREYMERSVRAFEAAGMHERAREWRDRMELIR